MKIINVYSGKRGIRTLAEVEQYNSIDQLRLWESFNLKGELIDRVAYHYGPSNELLQENILYADTEQTEIIEYEYQHGNLVSQQQVFGNEVYNQRIIIYDNNNRDIESKSIEDGEIIERTITLYADLKKVKKFYNDQDALIYRVTEILNEDKQVVYELDEEIGNSPSDEKTLNKYDHNGNLIQMEVFTNEKLELVKTYFYNDLNQEIKSEGYDYRTDIKIEVKKEYLKEGKLSREQFYEGQVLTCEIIREYNLKGEIVYVCQKRLDSQYHMVEVEELWYEIKYIV